MIVGDRWALHFHPSKIANGEPASVFVLPTGNQHSKSGPARPVLLREHDTQVISLSMVLRRFAVASR